MPSELAVAYESRRPLLEHVAHALESEVREYLSNMAGIGRVCFSILSTTDFLEAVQVLEQAGNITDPLTEVEVQISGAIAVASEQELITAEARVRNAFSAVEHDWRETMQSGSGALPTRCLLCVIPPQVKPPGWGARDDLPNTFEIRLRIDPTSCPPTTPSIHTLPLQQEVEGDDSQPLSTSGRVLIGLHGIRTHAGWCRALYEVAPQRGWQVRMDRWNFGYFNIILFLLTFARTAKVRWFRSVYRQEVQDKDVKLEKGQCLSIVAHSFGTYILGNALLKYDWLRFDKVVLCGAILPRDFPWNKLIDRGQVQAVRNEFGTQDEPTRFVKWFVTGTGPSGRDGFTCSHNRLEQERFEYTHSEYFDKGHMEAKWLPFLQLSMPVIPASELGVDRPKANRPWGLYLLYACLVLVVLLATVRLGLFARRGSDSRDRRTGEAEHITLDETSCVDDVQQAHRLRLSLNVKFPEISDPRECCKDAAGLGRWGNGGVEVRLSSFEDLPYVIALVRQYLEKQLGNGGDA